MTTTDVPAQVKYGQVVGHFVSFLADSADVGTVPDEVPLSGTITLTPLTPVIRWPTTSPPRLALPQPVVARVINGDLCSPDTGTPGIWLIATDQPNGQPDTCQWRATFALDGVSPQPASVVFNVPDGAPIDLSQAVPIPVSPPTILVVSHADAVSAAADADRAEAAADAAQEAHGTLLTADPAHSGLYLMTGS